MQVTVDDDFEEALKFFTKEVAKDGVLKEWRLKSAFESNRERRRRKEHMATRRIGELVPEEKSGPGRGKESVRTSDGLSIPRQRLSEFRNWTTTVKCSSNT